MKNKMLIGILVLVLLVALVSTACAKPAPTPTPTPTPAPAPVEIKPLKIVSNYHGADAVYPKGQKIFGDEVTKRTGGKVTFEHLFMGALGGQKEQISNLGSGLFQMAVLAIGYYEGELPLHNVFQLPLLTGDPLVLVKAAAEMFTMAELDKELEKLNLKALFITSSPSYEYMGKARVKTIEDFKGLKIRVTGTHAIPMKELGAAPVNITTTETAMAIDRGTVDGAILPATSFNPFGIHEVSKYVTFFGLGAAGTLIAMNLDTWKNLQPEVRQIMIEVAKWTPLEHTKLWDADLARVMKTWQDRGMEVNHFSDADKARMAKMLVPKVWDDWLKLTQSRGLAGQKVLDALTAAIKKYEGAK